MPNVFDLKKIHHIPDYSDIFEKWISLYDDKNYDSGLTAYFLKKSHQFAEKAYTNNDHFTRVLEVGAGSGIHLNYVRHTYDHYHVTDFNPLFVKQLKLEATTKYQQNIHISIEDAKNLSFPDNFFDRLIAAHILEHLERPHEVLLEWIRVIKPGGTLTIILPCDPGVLWRLGRYLVARKNFIREGFPYDYFMAREHINPINNLVSLIRAMFLDITEKWYPSRFPSIDFNLFYFANIKL